MKRLDGWWLWVSDQSPRFSGGWGGHLVRGRHWPDLEAENDKSQGQMLAMPAHSASRWEASLAGRPEQCGSLGTATSIAGRATQATALRDVSNVSPSPLPRSLLTVSVGWFDCFCIPVFNRERTRRPSRRELPVLFIVDFLVISESTGFLVTTWPSRGFAFGEGVIWPPYQSVLSALPSFFPLELHAWASCGLCISLVCEPAECWDAWRRRPPGWGSGVGPVESSPSLVRTDPLQVDNSSKQWRQPSRVS